MKRLMLCMMLATLAGPVWSQMGGGSFRSIPLFEDEEEDELWEERRGFGIAVNIGVHFANKFSANLYNGAGGLVLQDDLQGVRSYTIAERLTEVNIQDIQFIQDFYGATGVTFPNDMNPYNMRYNPAVIYGLNIMYYFNDYTQLNINANQMRIRAEDQFTLIFQGTGQQQNGQNDTRLFPIWGEETRLHLTAGLRQGWEINTGINWYLDGGMSMVAARIESNTIRVADRNFELLIGANNPNQIINYQPRTRTGFGWYAETGVSLVYNETYRIDGGIMMSRDRIRLESFDSMDYEDKKRLANWTVFLRFGI